VNRILNDRDGGKAVKVVPEDREATIQRLSAAFADDHLSTEELERRVADAYSVTTHEALARLTEDLPTSTGTVVPRQPMARRMSAVLGSVERRWTTAVPDGLVIRSLLGSVELDLREAEFREGVTEIEVRAVLGHVEVRLPDDVDAECHGRAFLGNFVHRATGSASDPAAASRRVVRITGRAVLGNVELVTEARGLLRP
jgi:hypothetical protein